MAGKPHTWRVLIGARTFGRADPGVWARLAEAGCDVVPNTLGRAYDERELLARIHGVDAIITGTDALSARVIDAADRLKVISKHGIGLEMIDLAAAKAKGVVVTATPGAAADSVADLTVALLLALARNLVTAHNEVNAGRWPLYTGLELAGKQAGIIGLGRIGKKTAQRLSAFGMQVAAYDPHPDQVFARAHGIEWLAIPELLAKSDVVCLHAPGDGRLLGRAELAGMKRGALLINTARGVLIDEAALADALRNGHLRGAGLDAFAAEPPLGSPLLGLPNVVLTPHLGAATHEALVRMGENAVENVVRVLRGEAPLYAVQA